MVIGVFGPFGKTALRQLGHDETRSCPGDTKAGCQLGHAHGSGNGQVRQRENMACSDLIVTQGCPQPGQPDWPQPDGANHLDQGHQQPGNASFLGRGSPLQVVHGRRGAILCCLGLGRQIPVCF